MMCTLAQRHDIQEKLRSEILDAQSRFGEDIPHDDLVALPYMDAFVRESLRMYVPRFKLSRGANIQLI